MSKSNGKIDGVEAETAAVEHAALSLEWEEQLAAVDARNAVCSASMSALADQLAKLLAELEDRSDGVVVDTVADNDSLMAKLDTVRHEFEELDTAKPAGK